MCCVFPEGFILYLVCHLPLQAWASIWQPQHPPGAVGNAASWPPPSQENQDLHFNQIDPARCSHSCQEQGLCVARWHLGLRNHLPVAHLTWEGPRGSRASLSEPSPPWTWEPGPQPTPASPPCPLCSSAQPGSTHTPTPPGCPVARVLAALCPLGGVMHTEMQV